MQSTRTYESSKDKTNAPFPPPPNRVSHFIAARNEFHNIIHPFYPFCNRHFAFYLSLFFVHFAHFNFSFLQILPMSVIFPRFWQLMRRAVFLLKTLAIIFFF